MVNANSRISGPDGKKEKGYPFDNFEFCIFYANLTLTYVFDKFRKMVFYLEFVMYGLHHVIRLNG